MGLIEPKYLLPAIERLELRRKWEPTTVIIYLSHFKTFLEYCDCYEKNRLEKDFSLSTMLKAVRDTRRHYSIAVSKCRQKRAKERFEKVPSLSQVSNRQQEVLKTLNADLKKQHLSLNQLKALNFFLLQIRLNVRSGPLLNITWSAFDTYLRNGLVYETNEHKTGKFYDVAIKMESDQVLFINELRQRMNFEFGSPSVFVFSNKKNCPETRMAFLISEAFTDLYGDNPEEVRFNANSVRKFWEKRVTELQLNENEKQAHLAQTAHSETTANKHYKRVSHADRQAVLNIYKEQLENIPEENQEDDQGQGETTRKRPHVAAPVKNTPAVVSEAKPIPLILASLNSTFDLNTPKRRRNSDLSKDTDSGTNDDGDDSYDDDNDSEDDGDNDEALTGSHKTTSPVPLAPAGPSTSIPPPAKKLKKSAQREKIIRSMEKFRAAKNPWTETEKQACKLFHTASPGICTEDVRSRLKEFDFDLPKESCEKIYHKIKTAWSGATKAAQFQ